MYSLFDIFLLETRRYYLVQNSFDYFVRFFSFLPTTRKKFQKIVSICIACDALLHTVATWDKLLNPHAERLQVNAENLCAYMPYPNVLPLSHAIEMLPAANRRVCGKSALVVVRAISICNMCYHATHHTKCAITFTVMLAKQW